MRKLGERGCGSELQGRPVEIEERFDPVDQFLRLVGSRISEELDPSGEWFNLFIIRHDPISDEKE
jgi:hypothetical protein